jgi:hypothetical protein
MDKKGVLMKEKALKLDIETIDQERNRKVCGKGRKKSRRTGKRTQDCGQVIYFLSRK